jgi:hypothetical protein
MNYTPQGGETEGNAADDILMVDQGIQLSLTHNGHTLYSLHEKASFYQT